MIGDVRNEGDFVVVEAAVAASTARCPGCETVSARAHFRYRRRLADAATVGRMIVGRLAVSRSDQVSKGENTIGRQAPQAGRHLRYTDEAEKRPLAHHRLLLRVLRASGRTQLERMGVSADEARNRLAEAMRDHREQLGSQRITRNTKLIDLAAELLCELEGDDANTEGIIEDYRREI
ncbi:hypothetical protein ACLMAL_38110 [Nocardia sp. CWNU-33]|uniref:hypothetical protein n=1 Tax=Nocardia sp. CWNU-33 TaxID=3392117 RepID=UPI00398F7B20